MAKRRKFAEKYRSLKELGADFNLSAVAVGKKLKEIGVRNADGTPTEKSLEDRLAVSTPLKNGTPYYRWDYFRCRKLLIKNGINPDNRRDVEIRKNIKSMLSIYNSEEWEIGGGLIYKYALAEFFDHANKLPVQSNMERVLRIIEELKASREDKDYLVEVAYARLAENYVPDERQIKEIFELNSYEVLVILFANPNIDEITRARTKSEMDKIRSSENK
jgi:hypothetical protein